MEFHEKLQELRKQKCITQEELARKLFVSRTAISKWESGKGYPNIDSLKAIAEFYGVTIDELLSSEEVLTIAETDSKERQSSSRDLVLGLLNLSVLLLFFLPLFGHRTGDSVQTFSLLTVKGITSYMRVVYIGIVSTIAAWGILMLALQAAETKILARTKTVISLILLLIGLMLFIAGSQPYAAALLLVLMLIEVFLLIRNR